MHSQLLWELLSLESSIFPSLWGSGNAVLTEALLVVACGPWLLAEILEVAAGKDDDVSCSIVADVERNNDRLGDNN